MGREDLVLSVERHATAKLADDGLDDIRTLGFRGEALASIGSVADLTIATRRAEACVRAQDRGALRRDQRAGAGGDEPRARSSRCAISLRGLPARLKFLKTDRAEAAAITDVVRRLAMANPGVHFVLDGTRPQRAQLAGAGGRGCAQGARGAGDGRRLCAERGAARDGAARRRGQRARGAADLLAGQFAEPVLLRQRARRCATRCCSARCARPMPTSRSATGFR